MIKFELFRAENLLVNYTVECLASPPSSLTLLQISTDNPLHSPAMEGTASVIIPLTLRHGSLMSSTAEQTQANKSVPLVWPVGLLMSNSSSANVHVIVNSSQKNQ